MLSYKYNNISVIVIHDSMEMLEQKKTSISMHMAYIVRLYDLQMFSQLKKLIIIMLEITFAHTITIHKT